MQLIGGIILKIEIWTDFVCPFCYIGKRKLEQALERFEHSHEVEVEYKSYQLNPNATSVPGKTMNEILAEEKGVPVEQMKKMNDQVTQMAKEVGLNYALDTAQFGNTFDAHRLFHYAKTINKEAEMMERFKKAYFIESLSVSDHESLANLSEEIGIDKAKALEILTSDQYANDVRADIKEASEIGAQGVPFFVFNRKYGISGAQPDEVFDKTLETVWAENAK